MPFPQTAGEADGAAAVPITDQLEKPKPLLAETLAETAYGGDGKASRGDPRRGLQRRYPGANFRSEPKALTLHALVVNERTGQVEDCSQMRVLQMVDKDHEAGTACIHESGIVRIHVCPEVFGGCPFSNARQDNKARGRRYAIKLPDRRHRSAARRREQKTRVLSLPCTRRSVV